MKINFDGPDPEAEMRREIARLYDAASCMEQALVAYRGHADTTLAKKWVALASVRLAR